uniref:Transcription elongation factor SPT4 homolog n=1 Tax=Polytomella sp. Pringsheim 198.80 TaxID=37502 RepID=A0A024FSJ9_9CHLO|nr:transcription elongation factor SPT4 homolog [Polytomella sp. Pringsheim 198.80]|mmetsp:Transcript_2232/g.3375  ORF Transcript_2232/g.3375 Transcript_2232/m.3375 type:complete len:124 (-) Transcript_2232:202-573(-)
MSMGVAKVPALERYKKADDPFPEISKSMVSCHICMLVKTYEQFHNDGCENCNEFLNKQLELPLFTTPNFSGLISIIEPTSSWAAKWLHLSKRVPGCYSLGINDEKPEQLMDLLSSKGLQTMKD